MSDEPRESAGVSEPSWEETVAVLSKLTERISQAGAGPVIGNGTAGIGRDIGRLLGLEVTYCDLSLTGEGYEYVLKTPEGFFHARVKLIIAGQG